jgi:hypothetical protein
MEQQSLPIRKIVLWSVGLEPVVLAGIGYFLASQGAFGNGMSGAPEKVITIAFAAASLIAAGLSFKFASLARGDKPEPGQLPRPASPALHPLQIISVALATVPGVLGFVHFILLRSELYLLIFNGGALAMAVRHIFSFEENRT